MKKILFICLFSMLLAGCDNPSLKAFSFFGLNFNQSKGDLIKNGFVCEDQSVTTDINCIKNSEGKKVTVNLFQNSVIRSIILVGIYNGNKESCDDSLFAIENLLQKEFNAEISYDYVTQGKSTYRINDKTVLIDGKSYPSNDGRGKIIEKLDYVDPEKSDSRVISYVGQCVMTNNEQYTMSVKFENKTSGGEDFLRTLNKKSI